MQYKKIDFSKFSSVRIGQIQDVAILTLENFEDFDGEIIGRANNILLSPNPPKLGVLDKKYDFVEFKDGVLEVGALTKSAKIYNFAKKHNLANFEFLAQIPGTLGGMIKMNAGLCGSEISDNLLSICTNKAKFDKSELGFSYRKSSIDGAIFSAKFSTTYGFDEQKVEFLKQKRANQPKGASFGSCFKNPLNDSAGRLIEAVKLKGFEINGAKFSEIHANFLINFNNAKFEDAIKLINLAKKRVFEEFGVLLYEEVCII